MFRNYINNRVKDEVSKQMYTVNMDLLELTKRVAEQDVFIEELKANTEELETNFSKLLNASLEMFEKLSGKAITPPE